MSNAQLEAVLVQIIALLRGTGHEDRADWLDTRLAILGHAQATPDSVEHVRGELHKNVLGMGGLMDLDLRPADGSPVSKAALRVELDSLADRMYAMTR